MTEATSILRVLGVTRAFGGLKAVDDASFAVAPGAIAALIGPNGAGKTSLFNVITGFVRADTGDVLFQDRSIVNRPPFEIARSGLVRTFQLTKSLNAMTVRENMLLAAPAQPGERLGVLATRWRRVRAREQAIRKLADELLEVFELTRHAEEYAGVLSGGQRKLLELARVLMASPTMILLDEPMAGVNPALGERLFDYITQLRDDRGITCLFVEHDMGVVMRRSEKLIVMSQGKVICEGAPTEVMGDSSVIDAYLGGAQEVVA